MNIEEKSHQSPPVDDARAAFRYPPFMKFQLARFFIVVATEMQAVAVGWQFVQDLMGVWDDPGVVKPPPIVRVWRFFSYFTTQSVLLCREGNPVCGSSGCGSGSQNSNLRAKHGVHVPGSSA